MASITIKDLPEDLHAVLKVEAAANFRSLPREVMARLQRSLDSELLTQRDQRWVDEALASGQDEKFSWQEFETAAERGIAKANGKVESA